MMKKRLTQDQEFQIMKLVLDKFLWLGAVVIAFGGWNLFQQQWAEGISWIVAGALILVLFMVLIIREYEIIR
jgi:fatty acid desaturase